MARGICSGRHDRTKPDRPWNSGRYGGAARLSPGITEHEQVLVLQATHYLPGVLQIIFLGALVSAILATVDSALLAAGSLSAHNLILPLLSDIGEQRKIAIDRFAIPSTARPWAGGSGAPRYADSRTSRPSHGSNP